MERKNMYIVILVITTILASCIAIYIGVNFKSEINILKEKNEELNSKIYINESNSNVEDENTSASTTEKIVYKYQRPVIDEKKCINNKDSEYSIVRQAYSYYGDYSATLNSSKEVTLYIDWSCSNLKDNSNKPSTFKNAFNQVEERKITNFEGNITDIYITRKGQDTSSMIYFLMEDGTVEYMPLNESTAANEYKSYGKLKGVEGVVEILEASTRGGFTPVGLKQDGTFYDLVTAMQ